MRVKKILVLCTGNSCRSQMAEAFLKSFDENLEVRSAGTNPASVVHPKAVQVMKEAGLDVSRSYPKNVRQFLHDSFDYVITVCDHARETCPVFVGKVGQHVHVGFDDPSFATGTDEEITNEFRRVRDEIREGMMSFYEKLKAGDDE